MGQINRIESRISGARLDFDEARHLVAERSIRRAAKLEARRARRRLDRAIVRAALETR